MRKLIMKKFRLIQLLGTGIIFILFSAASVQSATINWMDTTFNYYTKMGGTVYDASKPYQSSDIVESYINSGSVTNELNSTYTDSTLDVDATLYGGGTGGEFSNGAYAKAYATAAFNLNPDAVSFTQNIMSWVRREFSVDTKGDFNLSGTFAGLYTFTEFGKGSYTHTANYDRTGGIWLEEIIHDGGTQSLSTIAHLDIKDLIEGTVESDLGLRTDDGEGNDITYSLKVGFTGAEYGIRTEFINYYQFAYQGDLDSLYEVGNQDSPLVINGFIESSQVPVPGTMMLLLSGLGVLFGFNFSLRRRRGFKI